MENNAKYCLSWSILAYLRPCEDNHPSRVKNYRQCFNELNFECFDFSNGFKCNDMHRFEKWIIYLLTYVNCTFTMIKLNGNII